MPAGLMPFHCLVPLLALQFLSAELQINPRVINKETKNQSQAGVCTSGCGVNGAICSEPCARLFHGERLFMCQDGKWQKTTDSCANLDARSLFERISADGSVNIAGGHIGGRESIMNMKPGPGIKLQSVTTHGNRNCLADLSCIVPDILSSPAIPGNIVNIVMLLKNISLKLSEDVNRAKMQSYSKIANHVLNASVISNWAFIRDKAASSILLDSVNLFARKLLIKSGSESILEDFMSTKGSSINKKTPGKRFDFSMRFNNSNSTIAGSVLIPQEELLKISTPSDAVSVAFPTLGAIMEASQLDDVFVNGMILSVALPEELRQISLTFEKFNKSNNVMARCVGWHSAEKRWDEAACKLKTDDANSSVCICKHHHHTFKSFSILMSPNTIRNTVLDYITFVGLGISIFSLLLCLTIEAVVWHHVTNTNIAQMRHICLVNIAASLLIANVLFILAAVAYEKVKDYAICVAVTFFVHLSYLSLFFWMLALGLLILHGLLLIFRKMKKSASMATAFFIGYGCPLIISVLTVAITEPRKGYVRDGACWLNWRDTKALLAFVIPALMIIAVNLVVVVVVVVKTGRLSVREGSRSQDLSSVTRTGKNVALLTPVLGLTWGFGLATIVRYDSLGFHVTFALLNALQGFFILLFGTLLDRKTREALRMRCVSAKWKCSLTKS
ncbi:PREDICTED: adhesion G protein-coupled receptor F4-like [Crocodylus porosus]|uniref:adhesion G protein-coupled receptor F4-like n=1 Tax=Crocodylus porosus TaxID=8502 RepID=UPI00093959A4|nr:PREDICTED: adhesion G protein-coupled receptor F4-like [Crocodylus porosus]